MVVAPEKIDLNRTYPCPNPLCKCGKLQPITLTHALGCFQCQQIFAPTPDSLAIQSLTQSHLSQCSWYWQGRRWVRVSERPSGTSAAAWVFATIFMVCLAILALLMQAAIPGTAQAALIILIGAVVFLSVQLLTQF